MRVRGAVQAARVVHPLLLRGSPGGRALVVRREAPRFVRACVDHAHTHVSRNAHAPVIIFAPTPFCMLGRASASLGAMLRVVALEHSDADAARGWGGSSLPLSRKSWARHGARRGGARVYGGRTCGDHGGDDGDGQLRKALELVARIIRVHTNLCIPKAHAAPAYGTRQTMMGARHGTRYVAHDRKHHFGYVPRRGRGLLVHVHVLVHAWHVRGTSQRCAARQLGGEGTTWHAGHRRVRRSIMFERVQ